MKIESEDVIPTKDLYGKINGFYPPENIIKFGESPKTSYSGYYVLGTDLYFYRYAGDRIKFYILDYENVVGQGSCIGKTIKSSRYPPESFEAAIPYLVNLFM